MVSEKTRRNLTETQLGVLTMLYKFRFITVPLLTEYYGLKSNSIQRTLDILIVKELVNRKWDKSFVKAESPAMYYLTKQGIALLKAMFKDDQRINTSVLNSYYRNSKASLTFIEQKLDTLKVFISLKNTYGDKFRIFTQQELMEFDDFPTKKPDLFLRSKDNSTEYFVLLVHNTLPYLYRKQLKELMQHYDEEGWESSEKYPTLLFIFHDSNQEYGFLSYVRQRIESEGLDDDELLIGGTTFRAITSRPYHANIWTYAHIKAAPTSLV